MPGPGNISVSYTHLDVYKRQAFSLEAVGMTLLYVLLVYLLALGRSRRRIRRMQIHDFMELDRQNENVVIRTSRRRRRVFVLSLLLGAVGKMCIRDRCKGRVGGEASQM